MDPFVFLSPKWRVLLQGSLVFAWLSQLAGTDSRFSVYALCGVLGMLCLFANTLTPPDLNHCPCRSMALMALLFSAATVGANYPLFLPWGLVSLFSCLCSLAGGFMVGYHVLLYGWNHLPLASSPRQRRHPARLFWFVFFSVTVIDLLFLFSTTYPGALTRDSITTLAQFHTGSYDNTMPFYHTITVAFFFRLGMLLFGDPNAAVALFHVAQILFLAAAFSYAVVTLYQIGAPAWFLAAAYIVYTLLPYNIAYSSTLWKDIPFGAAALLLTAGFYRILRNVGSRPWIHYSCFTLGALGLCLWRTNGWYAFAATNLLMLFLLGKTHKKPLLFMSAITLLCGLLIGPVLSFLGVAKTNLIEALAVPFQQIGRVLVNGRPLSQNDYELVSYLFKQELVKDLYNPLTVDPMKFEALYHTHVPAIAENFSSYLGMYIRLGLQYPGDYLAAWVDETKGYWNGGYDFWIYTLEPLTTPQYGVTSSPMGGPLAGVFAAWFRLLETPVFLRPLYSIGLHIWVLVYCFLINLWKKRKEFLLTLPLLVLTVGLWLGTPVYSEFRYAYPMILSVPLILGVTLFPIKETAS